MATAARRSGRNLLALSPADLDTLTAHPENTWEGLSVLLAARDMTPTEGERVRAGRATVYLLECIERARVRRLWRVRLDAPADGPVIVPASQGGRMLTDAECVPFMVPAPTGTGPVSKSEHGSRLTGRGLYIR